MESWRPRNARPPRSKPDGRCKKHPKHQQSPGVCSVCLTERLSQLTSSSAKSRTSAVASSSSSLSSLSSLSSHYSSGDASPVPKRSISLFKTSKSVLTKSRSTMAFVIHMHGGEAKDGKKKSGFWSKLLPSTTKKMMNGGLSHSRTTTERMPIRVH